MTEANQTPVTTDAGERAVLLAQANTNVVDSAAPSSAEVNVPPAAARAAQSAFSEAMAAGNGVSSAIGIAVEQAKKAALSQGLSTQQADAVAMQVREDLGVRFLNTSIVDAAQVKTVGAGGAQLGSQGLTITQPGGTQAPAGQTPATQGQAAPATPAPLATSLA